MKVLLVSCFLLIIISCCRMAFKKSSSSNNAAKSDLQEYADALYPIKQDGKWGYLNNKMEMAIPAKFSSADDFSEGMAAVSVYVTNADEQPKEVFGYINQKGQLVIDNKYDKAYSFSNGFAVVVKDGKYGFVDKNGVELVPLQYDDASSFAEGFACVQVNGENGFINASGKMVIAPAFARACSVSEFSEGLAPVYLHDDTAGFIDSTGKFVIPPSFTYVSPFAHGLALVQPKGSHKYGYINKKGEFVIPAKYELSLPFSEGVATVKLRRPDGSTFFQIIGPDGSVIADNLNYGFVGIFREGLAGVESANYQWGFIDKKGKVVIAPKFASVRLFNNGLSRIETGHLFTKLNSGYIDKTGTVVAGKQKN